MNPETLKNIYEKDGIKGIKGYGAVVLRRSLTSVRSPFYYKYKKYYTNLVGVYMTKHLVRTLFIKVSITCLKK